MNRKDPFQRTTLPLRFEQLERRCVLALTFVDTGQNLELGDVTDVALGDLDGDNDLDAVVLGQPANLVLFNDGFGTFADSGQRLGQSEPWHNAELGDVDGDGDLDAILPDGVWRNDGAGNFKDRGQGLFGSIGDMDADGDLDVFASGGVWFNDGSGHFVAGPNQNRFGLVPVLGDFDGDNDLDALAANVLGNFVWLNDGTGMFSERKLELGIDFTADFGSKSAEVGDVDGDGDMDLVTPWYSLLNDGNANFTFTRTLRGIPLRDVDGDGDLDALVRDGGTFLVWLNDGAGNFIDSEETVGDPATDVELADLDGDGDLDAFVLSAFGSQVWLNQLVSVSVSPGDANGDLQFNQTDIVEVLQTAKFLTGQPATFEEGDWNNDGVFDQNDIVAALQTGNYLQGPYAAGTQW